MIATLLALVGVYALGTVFIMLLGLIRVVTLSGPQPRAVVRRRREWMQIVVWAWVWPALLCMEVAAGFPTFGGKG